MGMVKPTGFQIWVDRYRLWCANFPTCGNPYPKPQVYRYLWVTKPMVIPIGAGTKPKFFEVQLEGKIDQEQITLNQ